MANEKLSDREAKDILLKWPSRTNNLWPPPIGKGFWLQAQPKKSKSKESSPTIRIPGADLFKTHPDGMWVFLNEKIYADVICVEICGTIQNLNDKRSRYTAAERSLVLHCPLEWLEGELTRTKGGKEKRWRASLSISKAPTESMELPVRFARVLYALPNEKYKSWTQQNVPGGHEYFCRHSAIRATRCATSAHHAC